MKATIENNLPFAIASVFVFVVIVMISVNGVPSV